MGEMFRRTISKAITQVWECMAVGLYYEGGEQAMCEEEKEDDIVVRSRKKGEKSLFRAAIIGDSCPFIGGNALHTPDVNLERSEQPLKSTQDRHRRTDVQCF